MRFVAILGLLILAGLLPGALAHHQEQATAQENVLPLKVSQATSAYDGSRYAYIFGGLLDGEIVATQARAIMRYDTQTKTAELMPHLLPKARMGASAIWDPRPRADIGCPAGCAYVFGGDNGAPLDEILRYSPTEGPKLVARLPQPSYGHVSLWTGSEVIIAGGAGRPDTLARQVYVFDPLSNEVKTLEVELPRGAHWPTAIWSQQHTSTCPVGCAYIFGGDDLTAQTSSTIIRLDKSAGTASILSTTLPLPVKKLPAVFDGRYAYLAGGVVSGGNWPDSDRVIWFDPTTESLGYVQARLPWPLGGASAVWSGHSAYIFGGLKTPYGGVSDFSSDVIVYHPGPSLPPQPRVVLTTSALQVQASSAGTMDPDGQIASYAWTWGDGNTSTGQSAVHFYAFEGTYTVTLRVTDNTGVSNETSRSVTVARPPNVAPRVAFSFATNGRSVSADAGASSDPDGTIMSYAWQWGDGTTTSGPTSSHTYATDGDYTLRLTITDDRGATATDAKHVPIRTAPPPSSSPPPSTSPSPTPTPPPSTPTPAPNPAPTPAPSSPPSSSAPANQAPTARLRVLVENMTVHADASESFDPDGRILTYTWEWGDGTRTSGATATHTYQAVFTPTIRLTVTDDKGATATATTRVQVQRAASPSEPATKPAEEREADTSRASAEFTPAEEETETETVHPARPNETLQQVPRDEPPDSPNSARETTPQNAVSRTGATTQDPETSTTPLLSQPLPTSEQVQEMAPGANITKESQKETPAPGALWILAATIAAVLVARRRPPHRRT